MYVSFWINLFLKLDINNIYKQIPATPISKFFHQPQYLPLIDEKFFTNHHGNAVTVSM